ncbi:class I SAM-dependent methyltransferase [Candidatus Pelagibacter sp.]|jgi:hypothetical protein|nr:class I SAM-dependent methyltransferase [Candidatus Pelagibacter sp.]
MFRKLKTKYYKLLNFYNGTIDFDFHNKPKRWELINEIIKKKNYSNYLEIGCFDNECFSKINIINKVGVDPMKGGTIKKTSDEFFETNIEKFDIIFIDGLHEYDQIKRDIINSIKFLEEDGTIMCHDSLPEEYSEQTVPYSLGIWVGDVWKAIVEFRTKKDLDTCVCTIDHGVTVIKKRPNNNLLNLKISNYKKLSFKYFYKNYSKLMNLKNFEDCINFAVDK